MIISAPSLNEALVLLFYLFHCYWRLSLSQHALGRHLGQEADTHIHFCRQNADLYVLRKTKPLYLQVLTSCVGTYLCNTLSAASSRRLSPRHIGYFCAKSLTLCGSAAAPLRWLTMMYHQYYRSIVFFDTHCINAASC